MRMKYLFSFLTIALMLWAVGCSNNPVEDNAQESALNLEEDFGGYTTTKEAPAFGDPEVASAEAEEVEIDDPILATASMDSIVADPKAGLFRLRAVWGQLTYDSTVTTPTDWSGSLTVTRGGIAVRRLIRFERATDFLQPRTERALVEWASQTTVHNDGLLFDIYIRPPRPVVDSMLVVNPEDETDSTWQVDTLDCDCDPVEVTFKTGPYARTFTLGDLASLDTVVYLDDSSAVAFQAHQYYRNACPRGWLAGHWGHDEEGNGIFRGIWMDQHALISGYVTGHYGINDNGRRVFFGKWINRGGDFEGFLRGTWKPHPNVHASENAIRRAGGRFYGNIYSAARVQIGVLKGRYGNARFIDGGFFHARWKLLCRQVKPVDDELDDNLDDNYDDLGGTMAHNGK